MTAPTLFDVSETVKHAQHRTTLEREIAFVAQSKPRAAQLTRTAVAWQARAVHAAVVGLIVTEPPDKRPGMVADANAMLSPFGILIVCTGAGKRGPIYDVIDVKTGEIL